MHFGGRKRSRSLDRSKFDNSSSLKLTWSNWVESPFLDYLNLIDYEYKKKSFKCIPWFHISLNHSEILKYCCHSIYMAYKPIVLQNISECDRVGLPSLIQKFLHVSTLFNVTSDVDESSYLYYNIAYSLLDKQCEDPGILLLLWNTLCVSSKTKVDVLSRLIGKHHRQKAVKLLRYVMKAAHFVRFDFWGASRNDGPGLNDFNYCPVTAALLTGCGEQMSILLQYGFEPNSRRLSTYDNHFMLRVDCTYDWLRQPLIEKISTRRKTITEVLLFLVSVARCRSRSKRISMTECFYLLWSFIPKPYVTLHELRNEVRQRFCHPPLYSSIISPSTENQFMDLCDYYAHVFCYDSVNVLQPRPLMHLSKCAIRRQLHNAWNLPFGIQELNLPNCLKSYLQVETCM